MTYTLLMEQFKIPSEWLQVLSPVQDQLDHIAEQLSHGSYLPAQACIFAALDQVKPADIRVVICGQDPYPTPGDAHGLAFSVEHGKAPRSLITIFKEIEADTGRSRSNANLSDWAKQGVLLLNSILTVTPGQAGSHKKLGWQKITTTILHAVAKQSPFCVWLLWGRPAQKLGAMIVPQHHLCLQASHPSPLGCRQAAPVPFIGCRHFSQTNAALQQHGLHPISWT